MNYKLRNRINREEMEKLGFETSIINGEGVYMKVLSQKIYSTGDKDLFVLAMGFRGGSQVKKYRLTSYFNQIYDTRRKIVRKEDVVGLEEVIEDDNIHIYLQPMLWWRYIVPKRLILKYNKPIYKWLCFVFSKGEWDSDTKIYKSVGQ